MNSSEAGHLTPSRASADLALVSIALVWGGTFVLVKAALHDISTMCFLALRFALGAVSMALLFSGTLRKMPSRSLWRGVRGGLITGVLLWSGFALQTWGLERTSAGNSGFLTGLYIILVPLFSALGYRRWPRAPELIGIAVAGLGMILLTAPASGQFHLNSGDLLTIGCAVAFAIHLIVLGYFSQRERFEAVAIGQVTCTSSMAAAALAFEHPRIAWSAPVIAAILVTGLLATALAFTLQTWAQQYTTPTRTALILSLEPVFAYVAAVIFAHEAITLRSLLGGGLILIGILTVELKKPQEGDATL